MVTSFRIILRAARQWSANGGTRQGAALAYYALFSIAPLLVIAVNIAGAVFGGETAREHVAQQLTQWFGEINAATILTWFENAARSGSWAPSVSLALLIFGALSMFLHVRGALCNIWKLAPPRDSTMLGLLLDYGLALVMVFFCGVLLLASIGASMFVAIFQADLAEWMPLLPWHWVELGLSFLFLTFLFAAMYRILSGGRISRGYVVYGSFIAAVLFTFGKTLLGWYFVYSTTVSAYGAAGTLVVFLMWIYYSSQILFFGAELIQARRTRHEWMPSAGASATCSSAPPNL